MQFKTKLGMVDIPNEAVIAAAWDILRTSSGAIENEAEKKALVLEFEDIAAAAPFRDSEWNRTLQEACMELKRARCGEADLKLTAEWQATKLQDMRRILVRCAKEADFSQTLNLEEELDALLSRP